MSLEAQFICVLLLVAVAFAIGVVFGRHVDKRTAFRAAKLMHEDAARWPYTTDERFERVHTANELTLITGARS